MNAVTDIVEVYDLLYRLGFSATNTAFFLYILTFFFAITINGYLLSIWNPMNYSFRACFYTFPTTHTFLLIHMSYSIIINVNSIKRAYIFTCTKSKTSI